MSLLMKKLQNEFVRTPVNCLWENRVTWSEFLVFVTAISISSWKEAFHVNTGKKMIDVIKYDSVFFIIRCFQLIDIPYFLLDISYLETYVHFSNLDSIFSFRSDGTFTRWYAIQCLLSLSPLPVAVMSEYSFLWNTFGIIYT